MAIILCLEACLCQKYLHCKVQEQKQHLLKEIRQESTIALDENPLIPTELCREPLILEGILDEVAHDPLGHAGSHSRHASPTY
uniref:Uncharacterized protein n=1 Tax=Vombatus ursinus TaxID=29139 RepID=A0A4X2KZE3_VOMUR